MENEEGERVAQLDSLRRLEIQQGIPPIKARRKDHHIHRFGRVLFVGELGLTASQTRHVGPDGYPAATNCFDDAAITDRQPVVEGLLRRA
jgi:hypothetical protein